MKLVPIDRNFNLLLIIGLSIKHVIPRILFPTYKIMFCSTELRICQDLYNYPHETFTRPDLSVELSPYITHRGLNDLSYPYPWFVRTFSPDHPDFFPFRLASCLSFNGTDLAIHKPSNFCQLNVKKRENTRRLNNLVH